MMDAPSENLNNNPNYNYPSFPNFSENYDNILEDISSYNFSHNGGEENWENNFIDGFLISISVISIFGAVGNGAVIWLLGFCIKRNPFMTYILNLAVADFGVVLSSVPYSVVSYTERKGCTETTRFVFKYPFLLMYTASQFLLTAVSIDRCVAVFFPLWYQNKRPRCLSTIVCAAIWGLSVLLTAITVALFFHTEVHNLNDRITFPSQYVVNAVLCLPLMTVATVSLFIKVCLKARQGRRGRLLTIILLTLLFFILFAFPYNAMVILCVLDYSPCYMTYAGGLLASLNSSFNPVIYFLVGRKWKSRRRESMKMILQKAFKEEDGSAEETPDETQV